MERVKEKGENREVEGGRRVKRRKERPLPSATPPFPAALFPWRQHEAMTITSGRYYYPIMFSYNFDFLVHPPESLKRRMSASDRTYLRRKCVDLAL